jgi:hypothetical protein
LLGEYTDTHGFTLDLGTQRSGLSLLAGDARRSPSGRNRCEWTKKRGGTAGCDAEASHWSQFHRALH